MSLNSPRPPRPPRPGGGRPGTRPAGPARGASGLQGGNNDFGDTRTVILSRKNMGMHQRKKDSGPASPGGAPGGAQQQAPAPAPAAQPQLPKASVVNNTVSCVKCSGSFPILGDEYYGAVVECPDCAAEFIIPSKAEVMAQAPVAPPVSAAPAAQAPQSTPSPVAAPAPPASAPVAPPAAKAPSAAPAAKKEAAPSGKPKAKKSKPPITGKPAGQKSAQKKKPVRNVPAFVQAELEDEEEVFACESESGGAGSAILAAIMVLLTGGAGVAPVFLKDLDPNMKMIIPGAAGVVFAIVVFVIVKGSGGSKALVVTGNRVFAKAGKWFAQSNIDDD